VSFKPKPQQVKEPFTIWLPAEAIERLKAWASQENIKPATLAAQIVEHVIGEREASK
jgi:predicted DNA-binding protein